MKHPLYRGPAILLASGFRPFFLFCVLYAVVAPIAWAGIFAHGMAFPQAMNPALWHGHEMVFGFAAAAVAGFLLTAVPNWTGGDTLHGWPLGVMAAFWLAGRAGFWLIDGLPTVAVTLLDLPLLLLLAYFIGRQIVLARNQRNYIFIGLLGAYAVGNLLVHLELLGLASGTGAKGTYLGLYSVLVMLTVVTGRVVPSFTANALRMQNRLLDIKTAPNVEAGAVNAVLATIVADLALGASPVTGLLALTAAGMLALRMGDWGTRQTIHSPIVWVLHLGHGWLVAAFALKGIGDLTHLFPSTVALHAFTTGAVGVMLIAIASRAALGHSGRPLVLPRFVPAAYVLVALGALIRVLGPILLPSAYVWVMAAASVVWSAGFGLFGVIYWPILTRPRIDGKPG
ncbi:MAG: NnrS family protein [Magnetospirillum sp. WYHS-4]